METRASKRSAVAGTATALALTVMCGSASANHAWSNYHWARSSNPFTLRLGDNVSSAWDSYLQTASSDWSVSNVLDTTIVAGATTPRTCRAASGRIEVCNATYGSTGWLGRWLDTLPDGVAPDRRRHCSPDGPDTLSAQPVVPDAASG